MGLGASLFLIAGGAILIWGVSAEVAGLDVDAIGAILMVIGVIGLILSMIFWSSWGGWGGGRRRTTYVVFGFSRTVVSHRDDVVARDVTNCHCAAPRCTARADCRAQPRAAGQAPP